MSRIFNVHGIHIVLDKITHLGRIKNYGNDPLVATTQGVLPGERLFGLPIYFVDKTQPLLLTDKSEDRINELQSELISAIEKQNPEGSSSGIVEIKKGTIS